MTLLQRLAGVLGDVVAVEVEADGALTVSYQGTVASLRAVTIAEGLEMVSVTQVLAWDLVPNADLRKRVAALTHATMLGTVTLVGQPGAGTARKRADVMLRYNFPGAGLGDDALRTLILMVLAAGADAHRALTD